MKTEGLSINLATVRHELAIGPGSNWRGAGGRPTMEI